MGGDVRLDGDRTEHVGHGWELLEATAQGAMSTVRRGYGDGEETDGPSGESAWLLGVGRGVRRTRAQGTVGAARWRGSQHTSTVGWHTGAVAERGQRPGVGAESSWHGVGGRL
ncbi:hypothetical protein GUJ93_ZPchr0010g7524 [Zizania palustris]|uniref:Uncharacterized protein n=1 Tax=Zizania palustris TaxID=103762 RepID=A0A8J5WE32_ZIZPA|nr:hypothetical protein GUJ93_ZPchr0010g7524 [Zizania palustris]